MKTLKPGFVPALGTPLDKEGNLIESSLRKHIQDQIEMGASALLCMGSMGIESFIRADVYPIVAKAAVEAAEEKVPVFVGAMDTSIARIKQRIAPLEELDIDALVFTAPYYHSCSADQLINFFKGVAALTKHNIMLYDLPGVTQSKITYEIVTELIKDIPTLKGIKTADLQMLRKLKLNKDIPEDFIMVYSGLDTFDIACKWGIENCLDGMLSCTPKNTKEMFSAIKSDDYSTAAMCLSNIVSLRDCFVANDLWPSFTASMNMLGYEGSFSPDYVSPIKKESYDAVRSEMERIGEI